MKDPTILHVDMDAFYASVEVLEDPSLSGRPVIVGGTGARGVVASCSYEARAYGVRSAMPSFQARRLCPQAVFLPGRHDVYAQYSRRVHEVLETFTPVIEGIALDEAFLDVAGARRLFGPPLVIANTIRQRVRDRTGLSASVGVARSKFLAKLASEAAKPTATLGGVVPGKGVMVVSPDEELTFLHPLPVQSLWGVGPATMARLSRFGIRTIGELAALPEATLIAALGNALGRHLHALAWARDDRAVEPDRAVKSIGHEETYARDHHDHAGLCREAVRLSDAVASRLRAHGLAGRTVTLKVRFGDFRTITRSRTLPAPVASGTAIARVATEVLTQVDVSPGVRLLGVSISKLVERGGLQLRLVAGSEDPGGSEGSGDVEGDWTAWEVADRAVDEIRARFGDRAVGPAVLLEEGTLRVKRRGDQPWGPSGPRSGEQGPSGTRSGEQGPSGPRSGEQGPD